MKNESIIDEIIEKIEKGIAAIERAAFHADTMEKLVGSEEFKGRDDFMFLAGLNTGMSIFAAAEGSGEWNTDKGASVAFLAHDAAVDMLPEVDIINVELICDYTKACSARAEELRKECVCDACRAKREGEEI